MLRVEEVGVEGRRCGGNGEDIWRWWTGLVEGVEGTYTRGGEDMWRRRGKHVDAMKSTRGDGLGKWLW